MLYRGWKAIVFLKGNFNIWAIHTDRVHSISLLGSFVMWNIAAEGDGDRWVHYSQKNEGVHGKASSRLIAFLLRKHESQSLAYSLNSCL